MSQLLTFANGATSTVYGSLTGRLAYLGSQSTDFDDITTDESLWRLAVRARTLLDHLPWIAAYETFAARDALDLGTGNGDAAFPFRAASYELELAGLVDDTLLEWWSSSSGSSGSSGGGVSSMSAAGASISFREGGSAFEWWTQLPSSVLWLIGDYLVPSGTGSIGGRGQVGSDVNPFSESGSGRNEPW